MVNHNKTTTTWCCFRCLQSIIEGLGSGFNEYIDQDLLDLIFRALTHTNRFVRETGYYVCASLVMCGSVRDGKIYLFLYLSYKVKSLETVVCCYSMDTFFLCELRSDSKTVILI